jgi:hypothetical protein
MITIMIRVVKLNDNNTNEKNNDVNNNDNNIKDNDALLVSINACYNANLNNIKRCMYIDTYKNISMSNHR